MNNETLISAEDFFGKIEEKQDKAPARKGKTRGKKSMKDIFAELKIKMVMRIYGVSNTRAMEIIAGRADEKRKLEHEKDKAAKAKKGREDYRFLSSEDLFGS